MSRPHPALIDLAAGREPRPVADPWALLTSAREHRMVGLLWTWERRRTGSLASWRAQLQQEDVLARAGAERLWRALETVASRLDAIGIQVAVVKGVTIEARLYGRRGDRPCDDLDVLVGPDDLGRVGDIVRALDPGHPLAASVPALVRTGALSALPVSVAGVAVDLHFDLMQLGIPLRQARRIWERMLLFRLPGGGAVRVPDPETTLVHLLLNLNKDRFARLLGYVDIALLLRHEALNWDALDELVTAEGLETPTYLTLQTVCATLGLTEPGIRSPRGARSLLWRILWRPSVRLRGTEGRTRYLRRQHLLAATGRGRTADVLRLWWRLLFPARPLVEHAFPGEAGPWIWRLTAGRARHAWQRRRATLRTQRGLQAPVDPSSMPKAPVIDGAFIPVTRRTLSTVEVDGQAVLLDETTGVLCVLDSIATLAWACFDGSSPVGDVAADLAAEFGVDVEEVQAELISVVRRLGSHGMLEA